MLFCDIIKPNRVSTYTNCHHTYCILLLLQWQAALGWLCCLFLMAALVGLAYILRETPAYPSVPHALYQGLHRPLWALAVTWIILACEEGYGGKPKKRKIYCTIWGTFTFSTKTIPLYSIQNDM